MSKRTIRTFLSGTRRDLGPYWPVAADAVRGLEGFEPRAMDGGVASPLPMDQWSRRAASTPDLYVGLLGRCRGQVPAGQSLSVTEQEYDAAGLAGIDRLVFLTDDSDPERVKDESKADHEAVELFRQKVHTDVVFNKVESPADFKQRLIEALKDWERRTLRGATATTDDYYRPWTEGDPEFGHQDVLTAREGELAAMEAFAASDRRLLLLEASWGQGKSRLLLELARKLGKRVRFINEDAILTRETLDISAVDPCVVVLEDAQKRNAEERRRLLAFVRTFGPEVKLIVSSRSSHAEGILEDARQLGYRVDDLQHLAIEPLSDRAHRRLVAAILGGDSQEAHIIAERTKGSAIAGVLTARLFRKGAVTLGQIESGEEFRHSVLRAYEAALLEHAHQGVDQRFAEVLRLVAIAGPLRSDDDEVIAAGASLLSMKPHVVRSTLADLVDGDLVIRRGGLVRIPVDALAEDMRRRACVSKDGESLGFAEETLQRLWPVAGGSVLQNLAQLNWDLAQEGIRVDFMEAFWPRMAATYDASPASIRLRLLEQLEDTAPYAPIAIIALVRHALTSGIGPEETEELLRGHYKLEQIHDRLAKLLSGVLFHAAQVGEACDLLWEMAKNDERDPKHHTSSAERILQDAAKFRPRTINLACYQEILRWAGRRRQGSDAVPDHRLARYVRPVLERELQHDWYDGENIHMSAQGVSAKAVGDLRRVTLDLLAAIAGEDDLAAVAAAVSGIGHTLSTPPGAFGRKLTDKEIEQWYPEEISSLARLQRVREQHASRVVDLCVLDEIDWVAEHSEHIALREAAVAMMASIRDALAGSLELALSHAYQLYRGYDETREAEHEQHIAAIAAAHVNDGAPSILQQVRLAYTSMEAAGRKPDATALLLHLARLDPGLGETLVTEIVSQPEDPLLHSLGGLLVGIADMDSARALAIAEQIVVSGQVGPARVLANVYRFPRFVEKLGASAALSHLERLLDHTDLRVREHALSAIGFRDNLPEDQRRRLLIAYDLSASPESGEEWAEAIHASKLIAGLSDGQCRVVAAKLGYAAHLRHWCCDLIGALSKSVPDAVVDMLVARVPRAGEKDFDAILDRAQQDPLAAVSEAARESGMVALGAYMNDENFRIMHAASDLFGKLATGDRDLMRRVRMAWIRSRSLEQLRQATRSLESEESEFILEEQDLVLALLTAAEAHSPELFHAIESDLFAVASRGMRTGTPGEAFTRDVDLRDRAKEIAAGHVAGSLAQRFYASVARHAQATIDFMKRRDDEESA